MTRLRLPHFEGGEECAVVGAGDVCGFEVAYGHAFVMHDMVFMVK